MASREEGIYSCCSLCLDGGRHTVARHYCVDCETYFCTGCVKCHKLPQLKSHQVNDVNTSDTINVDDDTTTTSIQREVQHESSSEVQHETCSEVQHETSSEVQHETFSKVQHETFSEVQHETSSKVPDKSSSEVTDKSSSEVTDKSSSKVPDKSSSEVTDKSSSEVPDKSSSKVPDKSSSSLRCISHRGKLTDTYCKNHGEVCCGSCVLVKHRSCTTISITTAAKDFKSSPDMKKFKEALTENLVQCKQEKQKREDNNDVIGEQKLELLEHVDKYEEDVVAKVKDLANISRKEIRSIYEQHKTVNDTDIEALDVVIVANTECVDKLDQTDDEQLFIHAKTNKTVPKDGEMLLQALTKDWKEKIIQFHFDETLKKQVFGMNSLGEYEVAEYHATFQSKVNIKQGHESNFHVSDMCFTYTKDLLLIDSGNNKLKRFNSDLQFKDEIALPGFPVAVCVIDEHEVAVRIYHTKAVQFVSVSQSMALTFSFLLQVYGFGMTYDVGTEEIFACEVNQVSVYSKTGNKLRTYNTGTNDEKIFSQCRQVVMSENKQEIYVTDGHIGLIILEKNGTLKLKVSLAGVSDAWPLCVLPGGVCLTGGCYSGIFAQVDKDGRQVGKLIFTKDERQHTFCALYDHTYSRLIVGGRPSALSVYKLSATFQEKKKIEYEFTYKF